MTSRYITLAAEVGSALRSLVGGLYVAIGRRLGSIFYQDNNGDFIYKTLQKDNLGIEATVNGEFTSDSNWTKQTGWTISNGSAKSDGTQTSDSAIYQFADIVSGKKYKYKISIKEYQSGEVWVSIGGSAAGTHYSSNGVFEESIIMDGVTFIYMYASADFVGEIDSLSVREVLQEAETVVLDNQGSLGSFKDGVPYSGRGIELGVTNDVDIPIHHTLGSELYNGTSVSNVGNIVLTPITDGYNFAIGGAGGILDSVGFKTTDGATDLIYIKFTFNAVVNSGTLYITGYYNGTSVVYLPSPYLVVEGYNELEVTNPKSATNTVLMYFDGSVASNVDITSIASKQITNPNSYLTYYDFTDGLVTVDNSLNTPSTKYTLNTKTVNNFLTHTTPWSASDWARINNNPNLIGKLALSDTGTIPELDMKLDENNLILNSGFDTDTIWSKNPDWSIANGVATSTGTNTEQYIYQNAYLVVGRRYRITYEVTDYTSGSLRTRLGFGTVYGTNNSGIGTYIETLTFKDGINGYIYIESNNFIGSIDNVLVEEITDSYYMCSENEGAYLVDSRVTYGSELVTNGTFDTDTSWNKNTNWTISGGVAVADGTLSADMNQTATVPVVGKYYVISWEIVSLTQGEIDIEFGNVLTTLGTSVGMHTQIVKPTTTDRLRIQAQGLAIGSVDNVSVREATAEEIANYASTVRTNADLQQKGIQTTAFVTDGAGVPIAYGDQSYLQFDGDGRYVDTGWLAPSSSDFTFYILQYFSSSLSKQGSYRRENGSTPTDTNARIRVGQNGTTAILCDVGSTLNVISGATADSLNLITCSYKASTKEVKVYINSVLVKTYTATGYTGLTSSFYIGKTNVSSAYICDNKVVFYQKSQVDTQDEVTSEYLKLKTIYVNYLVDNNGNFIVDENGNKIIAEELLP